MIKQPTKISSNCDAKVMKGRAKAIEKYKGN